MTGPQGISARARWALALCFGLGIGMGLMVEVSEGWDVGGFRRVGPDSWKLALTVVTVALLYRLAYAISPVPGGLVRMGVGSGAYILAACGWGFWHGINVFEKNYVWMWGLLLVLGMIGVEVHRLRREQLS